MVIKNDNKLTGIYIELFRTALEKIDITPEFVLMPKMRARILFETGESTLSCCDNPAWRTRPLEQSVQLFTDAFYSTKDVFVFPKDKRFDIPDLTILSDKRVAAIRGYGYSGSEWFGYRVDLTTEKDLLEFIAADRADVGIVNELIFKYWQKKNPDAVTIGGTHDFATLHFRVHRKRHDLLEPLNKAINDIISSGLRDKIINRFVQ